jgi:hypothetical protein
MDDGSRNPTGPHSPARNVVTDVSVPRSRRGRSALDPNAWR